MGDTFLEECIDVLSRTPAALNGMLRGLSDKWLDANEGPGTWSPRFVVGHLIHGEKTDWMPRLRITLEHGNSRPFDAFDREQGPGPAPIGELLDELAELRRANLTALRELDLRPEQLTLLGMHPELGAVSIRQLLATWTAHDLGHILQVSRVMARRYKQDVGPWAQYLSVMR